jgi:dipeptidyl aminopeptidase/acylaminoacyl peptidase
MPYAEHLKGKLLVMHGMADGNMLFLHSIKLFRKLKDPNKTFRCNGLPRGEARTNTATCLRHYQTIL